MTPFLDVDWFELYATHMKSLPQLDGVDAVIQHEVTGTPYGKVRFYEVIIGGVVTDVSAGKHAEPDITLTWKYEQAVADFSGDKSIEVAFMEGRVKVEGDYRRFMLDLRPMRESTAWQAARAEVTANTQF